MIKKRIPSEHTKRRLEDLAYEVFKLEWTFPDNMYIKNTILRVNSDVIMFEDGKITENQLNNCIENAYRGLQRRWM